MEELTHTDTRTVAGCNYVANIVTYFDDRHTATAATATLTCICRAIAFHGEATIFLCPVAE